MNTRCIKCTSIWHLIQNFFFNDTATTEIYTLSLHDALPTWPSTGSFWNGRGSMSVPTSSPTTRSLRPDRKSTRLNSSYITISYAVFCLKKKKKKNTVYYTNIKEKNRQKRIRRK